MDDRPQLQPLPEDDRPSTWTPAERDRRVQLVVDQGVPRDQVIRCLDRGYTSISRDGRTLVASDECLMILQVLEDMDAITAGDLP